MAVRACRATPSSPLPLRRMDLSVFFAGTGGSVPSPRRGLPAMLMRRGGERMLFDCGEGTQRQLMRSVGLADVDCVFITHFHADHWLGLPGMLKSFALRERDQPLSVYGPRGLTELMEADALRLWAAALRAELRSSSSPRRRSSVTAIRSAPIPVRHRGEACLRVRDRRGRPPRASRRAAGASSSASGPGPTSAGCSAGRPSTAWRPSR